MAIKRFSGDKFSGLSADSAARNALSVLPGATFHETDTGKIYVYDGSSWVEPPTSPTTLAGLGDTTISSPSNNDLLQYSGGAWINVSGISAALLTSGVLADARVQQSNVTQHEGALSITESQITDLGSYALEARTITAGVGLAGGGDLTANRTIDIDISTLPLALAPADVDDQFIVWDSIDNVHRRMEFPDINAGLSITEAQISDLGSYIESSEKGSNNGVATLDGSGKIPTAQMPALALTEVHVVADITARNAISPVQEGDVAIVNDASADAAVDSGAATYIYDGSSWQLLKDPADVSLTAPGSTEIPYGDGAGDQTSEANLAWDSTNKQLEIIGSVLLDEGGTITTPAQDQAVQYVETEVVGPDTITRVKVRLGNGDDVILASYVQ